MSSFTVATNDTQTRTQRRLVFEGFSVAESTNSSRRNQPGTMLTSTPDHKLREKETEHIDLIQSTDFQVPDPCLLQLQNARQLLHSMSRTNVLPTNEQPIVDEQATRPELFGETNPELAYYKSSLESERNRRKQLETLIDVQQQRLTDAESELIQLRANDHKKTLCMKQLEQMIPNVVDEWKQKETDYKTKLTNLNQQIKQIEQTNREKFNRDKQMFDDELNEKILQIDRLNKDIERQKQDYECLQMKIKQNEQRIQQLTKDSEQAKQRWTIIENDLRNEIKLNETRIEETHSQLDKKQQEIEQLLRDQHKTNNDQQIKLQQLANELDEQRRENNVLKMELELREAKYRAQNESLKIQYMRESETKLAQHLEEQHNKHVQIEDELNELHRRKLTDLEERYEQILANERQEHENRVQILLSKLDQMKTETERIQSTTIAEREDLAKKLQDVFETALFKGSTNTNLSQNEIKKISSASLPPPPPPSITMPLPLQIKSQPVDTQAKNMIHDHPTSITAIRSLSSRIDSLVDQTNRVANGFELSSRLPISMQPENTSEWIDQNQNRLLPSQSQSTFHSPFLRSTPVDSIQDWYPQPISQLTNRSHSADPSSSGLFTTYPSQFQQATSLPAPSSSYSISLDSHLNTSHYHQSALPSYRSISSVTPNFLEHQQEVQATISKDSIEKQQTDQTSSTNESLTKYVKMLLERSPTQDNQSSQKHPLAKTNRSLHDIQLSLEQLNSVERDAKTIVDDLVLQNSGRSPTPRHHRPSSTTTTTSHSTTGGAKKRLDYDIHNHKQSNSNDLFERLSQPKTKVKKDKPKQQQQQHPQQSSTSGHGVWK